MAHITKIGKRWRAQVRPAGMKSKSKTFDKKAEAEQWARELEHQIKQGTHCTVDASVAHLVRLYRAVREESDRPVLDTSTEHYQLETLAALLGETMVSALTVDTVVEFAQARKREGAGPYTINMDISKLGTVLRYTAHKAQVVIPDVIGAARPVLKYMRLIGGGGKRRRRPTGDELCRLLAYFKGKSGATWQALPDMVTVALTIGLRRGELCSIRWDDIDDATRTVLVRDRKDPRQKKGNHQRIPLLGRAWDIVQAQPRSGVRVFPHHPQTVSKYFREAVKELSIPDLHFHDLRREAASALLEAGWSERDVRQVTGHASDAFEVYAHPEVSRLHQLPLPRSKA